MNELNHKPVLLKEILGALPGRTQGRLLDVTAGGGGHFFAILKEKSDWTGEAWDQDSDAKERILSQSSQKPLKGRVRFVQKNFTQEPLKEQRFDVILADLGISSFQLDDPHRGMSFRSNKPVDFRMDPIGQSNFVEWLNSQSVEELEGIFRNLGEEPRAKKLAAALKDPARPFDFSSAKVFADQIAACLGYSSPSKKHPATRVFQAFRMAINSEVEVLKSFLDWAPRFLAPGGRLLVISFHSIEDRFVKRALERSAKLPEYELLQKRPILPSEEEISLNPRARSSKLRILERFG